MERPHDPCCVELIARELRHREFDAVRSLWRVGDAICESRASFSGKGWVRELEHCARRLGMHPASLDEARRAAEAFPSPTREPLLELFEKAHASLSPSHVVVLARSVPHLRRVGIDLLLAAPLSVRALRARVKASSGDPHPALLACRAELHRETPQVTGGIGFSPT